MKIQTKDAAKLIGVTTKSVQNYVNRGLLSAQLGKHGLRSQYEFDLDEVITFAESNGIRVDANLIFELAAREKTQTASASV